MRRSFLKKKRLPGKEDLILVVTGGRNECLDVKGKM